MNGYLRLSREAKPHSRSHSGEVTSLMKSEWRAQRHKVGRLGISYGKGKLDLLPSLSKFYNLEDNATCNYTSRVLSNLAMRDQNKSR